MIFLNIRSSRKGFQSNANKDRREQTSVSSMEQPSDTLQGLSLYLSVSSLWALCELAEFHIVRGVWQAGREKRRSKGDFLLEQSLFDDEMAFWSRTNERKALLKAREHLTRSIELEETSGWLKVSNDSNRFSNRIKSNRIGFLAENDSLDSEIRDVWAFAKKGISCSSPFNGEKAIQQACTLVQSYTMCTHAVRISNFELRTDFNAIQTSNLVEFHRLISPSRFFQFISCDSARSWLWKQKGGLANLDRFRKIAVSLWEVSIFEFYIQLPIHRQNWIEKNSLTFEFWIEIPFIGE